LALKGKKAPRTSPIGCVIVLYGPVFQTVTAGSASVTIRRAGAALDLDEPRGAML